MTPSPKVAIVTAASYGMGAACARKLVAEGYRLVLMARSEKVDTLAKELDAVAVRGTVTADDDLAACVGEAEDRWGRLDAVVNNTGHPPKGDLLAIDDDQWRQGMELVLLNVVRMARHATPLMKRSGGGAVVNISAYGAKEPDLVFPVSSCLRAALGAYAKLYADRYAADGIRMNNVLPGFVDSYPVDDALRATIPLGRPATVDEIAATVAFLLSPAAGAITGQSIVVDGGRGRSF